MSPLISCRRHLHQVTNPFSLCLLVPSAFAFKPLPSAIYFLMEEAVCDELSTRIQEKSASGDKPLQSLPATSLQCRNALLLSPSVSGFRLAV